MSSTYVFRCRWFTVESVASVGYRLGVYWRRPSRHYGIFLEVVTFRSHYEFRLAGHDQ